MVKPSRCKNPIEVARRSAVGAGFTLIEMLVVLSIIALLLTIAVPRYFGAIAHSRELVLKDTLGILRSSIDAFHSDRGRYPVDLKELVDQHYIRAVPVDPMTEAATTWKTTASMDDAQSAGISDVHSGAPGATKDGVPYAQF
jgi:general secretion pathway protein G